MKNKKLIFAAGGLIGLIAVSLTYFGNPINMGICIACFIRDTAGALGLHRAEPVQYIRPELIGLVLGSLIAACFSKEFLPRGGSSPVSRFFLGMGVAITALVFLGCPLRMMLRLAGGDLSAIAGLVGFIGGISVGIIFLKRGYSLKRTYSLPLAEGLMLPGLQIALLALVIIAPVGIFFSASGPGSLHAPLLISLIAGCVVGALAQRTRLCLVGGFRDLILFKDWTLLIGYCGLIIAALVGNLLFQSFKLGFTGQAIAHNDWVWNFLSMSAVGLGSVLLGGCPLRQLILAGEGNSDSAVTVLGIAAGAAIAHNFKLASSAAVIENGVVSGGPSAGGKVATLVILLLMLAFAAVNSKQTQEKS